MILVVDDEALVLTITKHMVKRLGHEVMTAENGHQAVRLYRRHMLDIDGVILDVSMPGMPLADTCRQLKNLDDDVNLLLTSGLAPSADVRAIMDTYRCDFIQKPFSQQDFKQKLNAVINSAIAAKSKESASLK